MKVKSFKLAEKLFLNQFVLTEEVQTFKPIDTGIHYILTIDVSGSMSRDLSMIRQQLNNKLSSLVKEGNTITIVWFSGNNQAGVLKEFVEVSNLTQLKELQDAITKWLVPVGLTAFNSPLKLIKELIERKGDAGYYSLVFMTDGYNNDAPWAEVKDLLQALAPKLASSTFVEYGNYADTAKIREMSEITGGDAIYAEDFNNFSGVIEKRFSSGITSIKKLAVTLEMKKNMEMPTFFTLDSSDKTIKYYTTRYKKEIMVDEGTDSVFCLSEAPEGDVQSSDLKNNVLYAAFHSCISNFRYDEADIILTKIGDSNLFDLYINAYGKQKLNNLKETVKERAFEALPRPFAKLDFNNNKYCLLNLLQDAAEDGNFFHPMSELFAYERIGAKRVAKIDLSEDAKKEIAGAKSVKEAQDALANLEPEFEANENQKFPLTDLVWNESRANISIRTRYDGKVILPKNNFKKPDGSPLKEVDSFIWRNYTIIKDGIINMKTIPVSLTKELWTKLEKEGLLSGTWELDKVIALDISKMPIINRDMVRNVSGKELANIELELIKVQSEQKYYKELDKEMNPKAFSGDMASQFTTEQLTWMESIGITKYNGFAPKSVAVKGGDSYMSIVLETKIEKLSSIPKISDVAKKVKEGKPVTVSESLVANAMKEYDTEITNNKVLQNLNEDVKKTTISNFVLTKQGKINDRRKELLNTIALSKFAVILSRKWFKDLKTFDNNTVQVDLDGTSLKVTYDYKEVEVEI